MTATWTRVGQKARGKRAMGVEPMICGVRERMGDAQLRVPVH